MMHPYKILRFKSLDSTNATAKSMLQQGAISNATVIVADTQTAGRGQMQTKWHDQPGENLLFTIVVPNLKLKAALFFNLNKAVCLALADALGKFGQIAIKWPNDIFLNNRKVAGILIENTIIGDEIAHTCIGIGLNVNQIEWPPQIVATSLKLALGENQNKEAVFESILERTAHYLRHLNNATYLANYQNALLGFGELRNYRDSHGVFAAFLKGVNNDGKLILQKQDERKPTLYIFKEVEWIF